MNPEIPKNYILVIGYFGYETNQLDGQTIKTRSIYSVLEKHCKINYFDTQSLKRNKLAYFRLLKLSLKYKDIIYIGGQNNLKYFYPFLYTVSRIARKRITYVTVGGWLNTFIEKNTFFYKNSLKKINSILVETKYLQSELNEKGFNNVDVIPNFRVLPENYKVNININESDVFRIVFMARIVAEKGVFLLIDFYKRYLEQTGDFKKKIIVDFYGQIHKKDEEKFINEINKLEGIAYKGVLEPSEIYSCLIHYDVLVLPTYYEGEGFPGTILDAYHSGLPVITTKWKQIPEFVDHYKSGFLINYDINELRDAIKIICNEDEILFKMKKYAYEKSKSYSEERGWEILKDSICL